MSTRIPTEALLDELRRLATEVGRAPSRAEMQNSGEYSATTYANRFGTWTEALRLIGLEPQQPGARQQISKTDIRDAIHELADQLGRVPTATEMEAEGRYSPKTAQTRYGSWNTAIRDAGFEPTAEKQISKDRLLDEIRRLADSLGHPPSTNDLVEHGAFSIRPYLRLFEGWHSAVRAAGYEPRGWPSGKENPNWTGGEIDRSYGPNWDVQRSRALHRDGYMCQIPGCTVSREEHYNRYGKDLNVHHIVPVRTFLNADDPDYEEMNELANLLTLCVRHHTKWEQISPLCPDIRE